MTASCVAWTCVLALAVSVPAAAQSYPAKPIRIVTSGVGGSPDLAARVLAVGLASAFGQPAIVDNRSSGVMPGETVARAPADGYTLLVTSGILWTGPLLQSKVPYDPLRDFAPITLAGTLANILVIHPSLPVTSVRELIEHCKARPGRLNYASSAMGSSSHLAAELLKSMAGIDLVQINYKGAGPALNGMLSGEAQVAFVNVSSVAAHLGSGRLRALATGSMRPSASAPGLPTMAEAGVPGYESVQSVAAFAPAGTPTVIVSRLNLEMHRVLKESDAGVKLSAVGMDVITGSPQQLAAGMKSEMARLGALIRQAGIRIE